MILVIILQVAIFITLIFLLFFILLEPEEKEERDIYGTKLKEDYKTLQHQYEIETKVRFELEDKVRRLWSLADVTSHAGSLLNENDLFEYIATRMFYLIGYGKYSILLLEKDGTLTNKAMTGFTTEERKKYYRPEEPYYRYILNLQVSVFVRDLSQETKLKNIQELSEGSFIAVPLLWNGKVVGVIEGISPIPGTFKQEDLRVLSILADLVMISLENIRLYQRTQELSIRDGLTSVYLHRYFQQKLDEEIKRTTFYNLNLSLIICDIDHFKKCNDTYGHTFGDKVLKEVAKILSTSVREIDFVARYGGDEFAIILPETPIDGAKIVAERIRDRVQKHIFKTNGHELNLSMTLGVACFSTTINTKEALIAEADRRLYQGKTSGKNIVVSS